MYYYMTEEETHAEIMKRLDNLKRTGMTIKELAEKVGVVPTTLYEYRLHRRAMKETTKKLIAYFQSLDSNDINKMLTEEELKELNQKLTEYFS